MGMTHSSPRSQRSPVPPIWRSNLNSNQLGLAALSLVSLGLLVGLTLNLFDRFKVHRLILAAGDSAGESYILSKALETVVERHYPKIDLTVQETGGTSENLKLLETDRAQLATAQADIPTGPTARLIADLYEDKFQLLVRRGSGIKQFTDLAGKRLALQQKGGQYKSFLKVAQHYGLRETDFRFVGQSDQDADEAFLWNRADAVFRVRALGNPTIATLIQTGNILIPIEQAAAMKIKYPALRSTIIPQGTYRGDPAIPAVDLATVGVERTLLARETVDPEVVRAITSVLFERRQELAAAIPPRQSEVAPLLANIHQPETDTGMSPPLHPGAQAYYDRDKPSFIQEYADYVGLILTVILLMGSWVWEGKRWIERQQKNRADAFSDQVIQLMNQARSLESRSHLEDIRQKLIGILTEAVDALNEDRISEESFQSFRVVWQIALDLVRERRDALVHEPK